MLENGSDDLLYEYLVTHYEAGEPIFTIDVEISGMSEVNLRQQFKVLTDSGRLARYEKGVYYIPRKTRLKGTGAPSADVVAYYKYISRNSQVNGYYSGHTFANQIGLSAQVPCKIEIVSNNIAAKRREISIGRRAFVVRKSEINVTAENYKVLQLLDLLKNLDRYIDDDAAGAAEKLADYVKRSRITRADVDKYISSYSDSVFRHFYEMRLDYVLA